MTADVYENRQALFDAARVILDAQDCYEGETRIKKWAVILAAHVLDGKDRLPKPSKTRFGLSEGDIIAAKALAKEISDAITAAEAATFAAEEEAKRIQKEQNVVKTTSDDLDPDIDVLQVFLDAFHTNSSDIDDDVAKMVLLSFMGGREISGDGIHNKVTAEAGVGKSLSTDAGLFALPCESFYSGAFSDKALIYDKSLQPGMIIKLDEAQGKSEVFQAFVKEAISSYQKGVEYRTVIDKETVVKEMPPRLTFVVLSPDSWGDEQSISRFAPIGLTSRDAEKKIRITNFRLERRLNGLPKFHESDAVLKSRGILRHFMERTFKATIPFTKNIGYNTGDQRLQELFECSILYHAVLCYKKRKTHIDKDLIIVEATREDFDWCCDLPLFRSVEKAEYRLTPSEIEMIAILKKYEGLEISRTELVAKSGKSGVRVTQILRGRDDRAQNGLLSKLGITERSVSHQEYADSDQRIPTKRTTEIEYSIPATLPNFIDSNGQASIENAVARWVD